MTYLSSVFKPLLPETIELVLAFALYFVFLKKEDEK